MALTLEQEQALSSEVHNQAAISLTSASDGFFSPIFVVLKKDGGLAPSGKLKDVESVHPQSTLQDEHSISEGCYLEGGPHGASGSERCMPLDLCDKESLGVSEVSMERA